jgi:molybdate/tungstate transport system substrate-binding protein
VLAVVLAAAVSVFYAGSLATPMQGPITSALQAQGIELQGEAGGSKKLASLIASGAGTPDVFICVDRSTLTPIAEKIASQTTFATTSIGLSWYGQSSYAQVFDSVLTGETPLLVALATPGVRIGRTDPLLDPKGDYTISALSDAIGANNEQIVLGKAENPTQIFPEEELVAALQRGDIDVAFVYRTEAIAQRMLFIPFPGATALNGHITFTLAIMKDAPHPDAARKFTDFILTGAGRSILQQAGLTYVPIGVVAAPTKTAGSR